MLNLRRVVDVPFPSARLASFALRALQVDAELSPLVQRAFSLASPEEMAPAAPDTTTVTNHHANGSYVDEYHTVLRTKYRAKTNRMLRVAVNGFMESLGVVLGVMQELDLDVLSQGKSD